MTDANGKQMADLKAVIRSLEERNHRLERRLLGALAKVRALEAERDASPQQGTAP